MSDASALSLLADEAEQTEVADRSYTFGGETFTVGKMDIRAIAALQRGDMNKALVLTLGKEQADRLMDLETDEVFDEAELARLMEVFAAGQGSTLGESGASPSSSKPKRKR